MSDPRYKNNVFRGNGYMHSNRLRTIPRTPATCPLLNGWSPIEVRPSGHRIWQLDSQPNVQMRRVEADDPPTEDEWIVFLDGTSWATYSGPIDEITDDIINTAKLSSEDQIFAEALLIPMPNEPVDEWADDYGLSAIA